MTAPTPTALPPIITDRSAVEHVVAKRVKFPLPHYLDGLMTAQIIHTRLTPSTRRNHTGPHWWVDDCTNYWEVYKRSVFTGIERDFSLVFRTAEGLWLFKASSPFLVCYHNIDEWFKGYGFGSAFINALVNVYDATVSDYAEQRILNFIEVHQGETP